MMRVICLVPSSRPSPKSSTPTLLLTTVKSLTRVLSSARPGDGRAVRQGVRRRPRPRRLDASVDPDTHFMGGYGIVGGQIPLAVGAAFALAYQEQPGIVLCQMGDATTNIGAWHESLNLAKLYRLPVLFFIVNNGYGMGTAVEEVGRASCRERV